jgi:hypothetical protein
VRFAYNEEIDSLMTLIERMNTDLVAALRWQWGHCADSTEKDG